MALPIKFQIPPEEAVVSYSWSDLEEGTGYVEYYAIQLTDTSGTTYALSKSGVWSSPPATGTGAAAITKVNVSSGTAYDFDVEFNRTQRIKGLAKVFLTHTTQCPVGHSGSNYVLIQFYHYDGSTETQIGSNITTPTTTCGANDIVSRTEAMQTEIATIAKFNRGDILRMKVTLTTVSTANATHVLPVDPSNRDWVDAGATYTLSAAVNPTYFKVQIPFVLDD